MVGRYLCSLLPPSYFKRAYFSTRIKIEDLDYLLTAVAGDWCNWVIGQGKARKKVSEVLSEGRRYIRWKRSSGSEALVQEQGV